MHIYYLSSFSTLLLLTFIITTNGLSIHPGTAYWTSTSGVPIQAHGGGFLRLNGTFYWFGEDKTEGGHLFHNVNCYRSTNLVTWDFLGSALSASDDPSSDISPSAVVERPKVVYNRLTQKFVMWFHLDSENYGLAKLGVAQAERVEGPYEYLYSISPFGEDSRDMTVWVDEADPEMTAYLVYATRVNLDTVIAKLTPNYLDIGERLLKLDGIHREAYALFKVDDLYVMVMSRATGWDANANEYMYSRNMSGPWSDRYQLAPGSSNTFESQANYVIDLGQGQFIYAGDRWNRNDLSDSKYVWLPINTGSPSENGHRAISIHWSNQWDIEWDDDKIYMSNRSSRYYDARSPGAELIANATLLPCSGCENGESVGYIGHGGKLRFNGVYGKGVEHTLLISYANGDENPRFGTITVNDGEWSLEVTFPRSGGGQVTKQIAVQVPLTRGSVNRIEISNERGGYGPDLDYVKVECVHEDCGGS